MWLYRDICIYIYIYVYLISVVYIVTASCYIVISWCAQPVSHLLVGMVKLGRVTQGGYDGGVCVLYTLLSVTSVLALQWRMFEHNHSYSACIWLHMARTPGPGCSECETCCQSGGCLPKLAFC